MLQCVRCVLLLGYVTEKSAFIIHAYITVFYHSQVIVFQLKLVQEEYSFTGNNPLD